MLSCHETFHYNNNKNMKIIILERRGINIWNTNCYYEWYLFKNC